MKNESRKGRRRKMKKEKGLGYPAVCYGSYKYGLHLQWNSMQSSRDNKYLYMSTYKDVQNIVLRFKKNSMSNGHLFVKIIIIITSWWSKCHYIWNDTYKNAKHGSLWEIVLWRILVHLRFLSFIGVLDFFALILQRVPKNIYAF